MAVNYLHGIETIELNDGARPIDTVKSSVIGLVGTAPNADPTLFPLNTPVAIFADALKAQSLGTAGTLLDAVDAIFAQRSAVIVVVRVAEGADESTSWSNFVGSPTGKTGIWALLNARPILQVVPKLLVAPGYTSDRPTSGVSGVEITAGGSGYASSTTTVAFSAPAAGGRIAAASAQVVGGAVTGITVTDSGYGYAGTPTVTIAGAGTGAAAGAALGSVANPVGQALAAIVDRLRAVAYVDGPGTSYADAVSYRNDYGSQRVMVVDPGVLKYDTVSSAYVNRPASAYAAGLQARVDVESGFWFPFSNLPIQDIGGPSRPVDWMINDVNSEANILNSNQVTTIIHDDGFRFWGLRGTGTDPLWAQMAVRRTADMIYESLEKAQRDVLDKPFSYPLLRTIENSTNDYMAQLVSRGALIGGQCWIDPSVNTPASFSGGELTVDFDLEPPASLEHMIFRARRNPNYYTNFVEEFSRLVTQTN